MNREPRRALAMALIVATSGAQATAPAVIIVAGDCTLPDAIEAANTDLAVGGCDAGSGADEVRLTGDVLLTEVDNDTYGANGLPQVTSEIALKGGGFTIERAPDAPRFRLFQVASSGTLSLEAVRLVGGTVPGNDDGGIIHSHGSVRLTNGSIVESGSADSGGGIWSSGSLTLNNSTVSENYGTGIVSSGSGSTLLVNSTVADNYSYEGAGGISSGGYLKLVGSRVERNETRYGSGAGINASGATVVIASAISNNTADYGGGIWLSGVGTLYLRDSTVSGNAANSTYGGYPGGLGGGLRLLAGAPTTIVNSTISDNFANDAGGGLSIAGGEEQVTLINSTISGNSADSGAGLHVLSNVTLVHSTVADNDRDGLRAVGGDIALANSVLGSNPGPNCSGPIEDLGGNLADDASCGAGVGDLTGLDRVLRNNGGPTLTHALLAGSSAIDAAGDCEQATDQRGFIRDALCDSGSFEFGAVPLRVALAGSCPGALTVGIRGASADGRVAVLRGSRAGLFELAAGPCAGTLVGLADPRPLAQVTADADGRFVTEVNVPAPACSDLLQVVDHVLRREGGPPAHDDGTAMVLGEDVPQRLRLAVGAADRHANSIGPIDQEPRDAVLGGWLAGGDAGPDHRRDREVRQRRDRAPDAALAEGAQMRQVAACREGIDDRPVSAVDSDDDGPRAAVAHLDAVPAAEEEHGSGGG